MQSSRTPWKKSRTYGDLHGGRARRRMTDNIFARAHSLKAPGPDETRPVLIEENPSKDSFFPISAGEALEVLKGISPEGAGLLTHIWLRRRPSSHSNQDRRMFSEFVCGSGVRAVILYPWEKDGCLSLGEVKPSQKTLRLFSRFGAEVHSGGDNWSVRFPLEQLRVFFIQHLLLHEFAHHLDWYERHWSKANKRQVEEVADQYAVRWSSDAVEILSNLEALKEG